MVPGSLPSRHTLSLVCLVDLADEVCPGVAHHITQRGVDRGQRVLLGQQDAARVYLDLIAENLQAAKVRVL